MRGRFGGRAAAYALLVMLVAAPALAFSVGPLESSDFAVRGAAGPAVAFSAGVLSFVSPCVLPLVPIYLTHLSGATVEGGRVIADRRRTFAHALAFVAGLSLVFVFLGASVGLLGSYVVQDHQRTLERAAGWLLMLMGAVLMPSYGRRSPVRSALLLVGLAGAFFLVAEVADLRGDRVRLLQLAGVMGVVWLRFSGYLELPFLARTFQFEAGRGDGVGYGRSAVVGGAFALGWTPCIGPFLGSILALGATQSNAFSAVYLLAAYSAGLSVPFLIAGLALGDTTRFVRRIERYAPVIEVVSAVMLIVLGMLLVTGRLTGLNRYFTFAGSTQGL